MSRMRPTNSQCICPGSHRRVGRARDPVWRGHTVLLVLRNKPAQPRAPPHEDTLGTDDGQSPGREAPGGSVPRTSPQSREGEPTAPTPWCRLWGGAGQWLEAQAEEPAGKPGCVGSRQPPAWLREGGKEVERKKPEPVTHGNLGGVKTGPPRRPQGELLPALSAGRLCTSLRQL